MRPLESSRICNAKEIESPGKRSKIEVECRRLTEDTRARVTAATGKKEKSVIRKAVTRDYTLLNNNVISLLLFRVERLTRVPPSRIPIESPEDRFEPVETVLHLLKLPDPFLSKAFG